MSDAAVIFAVLGGWLILQYLILPRFGVST